MQSYSLAFNKKIFPSFNVFTKMFVSFTNFYVNLCNSNTAIRTTFFKLVYYLLQFKLQLIFTILIVIEKHYFLKKNNN